MNRQYFCLYGSSVHDSDEPSVAGGKRGSCHTSRSRSSAASRVPVFTNSYALSRPNGSGRSDSDTTSGGGLRTGVGSTGGLAAAHEVSSSTPAAAATSRARTRGRVWTAALVVL